MMLDNSNDSEVKLIDFGLSKQFSGENDQVESRNMKTVVGTPLYVAPEIFKGFNYY
jgi:serine/threonine protein kinase